MTYEIKLSDEVFKKFDKTYEPMSLEKFEKQFQHLDVWFYYNDTELILAKKGVEIDSKPTRNIFPFGSSNEPYGDRIVSTEPYYLPHDLGIVTLFFAYMIFQATDFEYFQFNPEILKQVCNHGNEIVYLVCAVFNSVNKFDTYTSYYTTFLNICAGDITLEYFAPIGTKQLGLMYNVSQVTARRWCNEGRFFGLSFEHHISDNEWQIPLMKALTFITPQQGRPPKNA